MRYNFDELLDRRESDCLKYGALQERWGRTDLLPLWVADMDFRTPDFIIDALRRRLQHEVLGYTMPHPDWRHSIIDWQWERHGWRVQEDEISFVPGIVRGIAFILQCFTAPGERVLVMNPVYHPFFLTAQHNGRTVVYHTLQWGTIDTSAGPLHQYVIDFDRLDRDLDGVKVMVLSNPHNPGGRVWTADELRRIAQLAQRHGTLVVSDEIHADLTLLPYRHTPYATVSETARQHSFTFSSPSKAFNTPGIVTSYCIVPNADLRHRYFDYLAASELNEGNMFAQLTCVQAYRHGADWLGQVKEYISANIDYVIDYCRQHLPGIVAVRPQASYLIWLDCRALGLTHDGLLHLFIDQAHLALNDGEIFGTGGKGFMRLNAAAPRSVIEEAMGRLSKGLSTALPKREG